NVRPRRMPRLRAEKALPAALQAGERTATRPSVVEVAERLRERTLVIRQEPISLHPAFANQLTRCLVGIWDLECGPWDVKRFPTRPRSSQVQECAPATRCPSAVHGTQA